MRILTCTIILAFSRVAIANNPVLPGGKAPPLSDVHWLRGDPVTRFEQGQVYVVEFWSTWCGACIESIGHVNDLANRYGKNATFLAIHIWPHKPAPSPSEFFEKRLNDAKPIFQFAVAEDVDGKVSESWMDATQSAGLPTAMIIDREQRLAWFGHTKDLEKPLKEIVDGNFDFSRSMAEMKTRIRVGQLAKESGNAIANKEYETGSRLILEALIADPDTVAEWIPSTYGQILATSRSQVVAKNFAHSVLKTAAGNRKELLAGVANAILYFRPKELRDLDFALELARKADIMAGGGDPQIVSLVATLRAELGDHTGAIEDLETAVGKTSNETDRMILSKTLNELRQSADR